jgi:hypothetical protein
MPGRLAATVAVITVTGCSISWPFPDLWSIPRPNHRRRRKVNDDVRLTIHRA